MDFPEGIDPSPHRSVYTLDNVDELISMFFPKDIFDYQKVMSTTGIARANEIAINDSNPSSWSNPLEARLPKAPSMKIYCFYGVGKPTERAYHYRPATPEEMASMITPGLLDEVDLKSLYREHDPKKMVIPFFINNDKNDPEVGLEHGVYHVDGDGSVPLISLGYMSSHVWPNYTHFNPSSIPIINREYRHEPSSSSVSNVRSGPKSGEHVDILGNHEMMSDIIKIVSGFDGEDEGPVEERYFSNIREIAKRIKLPI